MRDMVFISHCSKDYEVAKLIHDFLVLTGIPDEQIKCSSIPGNDVDQRFPPEIKRWLDHSAVNIIILSRDYFESSYCLNEAGIIWYQKDEVPVITIGLTEIDQDGLKGFLDYHNILRRLDKETDIAKIYDIIHKTTASKTISGETLTARIIDLKKRYKSYLNTRFIDSKLEQEKLTDREKQILSLINTGTKDTSELAILLGITKQTVQKCISHLINIGKIQSDENRSQVSKSFRSPEQAAKHLVAIRSKIQKIMIDTSWVKTTKDRIELGKTPHQQFRNGNAILIDPTVETPDYNNGMIKVEPYDLTKQGILVSLMSGELKKKIWIEDRGLIEVDALEEILFPDIFEVLERWDPDNPYPTLFCRFVESKLVSKTVYVERSTGKRYYPADNIIDQIRIPTFEVNLLRQSKIMSQMEFEINNTTTDTIFHLKAVRLYTETLHGQTTEIKINPQPESSELRSNETTTISLHNTPVDRSILTQDPTESLTINLVFVCENEQKQNFYFCASNRINAYHKDTLGKWQAEPIAE